jgi:hypothetical protein
MSEKQKEVNLSMLMDMEISVRPEYLKEISEKLSFQNQVLNKLYENTTEGYLSNLPFCTDRQETNKEVKK